jgi:putative transposase
VTAQLRGEYPLAVICRVLHLPRSSVYAHDRLGGAGSTASAKAALCAHIEQIATTWPTYGYRRVTAQLRREAEPAQGTNSRAGAPPHA